MIERPFVFVSHSSQDSKPVAFVCSRLESRGIACWRAPRDIPPGMNYAEAVLEALEQSAVVLVFISRSSMASPQVMREVERAVNKGIAILPIRLDETPLSKALEYFVSSSQWLDARHGSLGQHMDAIAEGILRQVENVEEGRSRPITQASAPQQVRSLKDVKLALRIGLIALFVAGAAGILWKWEKGGSLARCSIVTTPAGASVWIDSSLVGISPIENCLVSPGKHSLLAVQKGFMPVESLFVASQKDSVSLHLQFIEPILDTNHNALLFDIWSNKGRENLLFFDGDAIVLSVKANHACYARVVFHSVNGKQYSLTGLRDMTIEPAMVNKKIDLKPIYCGSPFGNEWIEAYASVDPLPQLRIRRVDDLYVVEGSAPRTRSIRAARAAQEPVKKVLSIRTASR